MPRPVEIRAGSPPRPPPPASPREFDRNVRSGARAYVERPVHRQVLVDPIAGSRSSRRRRLAAVADDVELSVA
jgi:hypothetical protein